jgi:hypothetical protein
MRWDSGSTNIGTAGTQVQISNTQDDVKSIAVKARKGNTGKTYFGLSDVSSSNGWELEPGEGKAVSFGAGSVKFAIFWVDAAADGDDVDWSVVLNP